MIANALTFVTRQLNDYFNNALQLDHTMVALSRLTNPNIDGKLVLSLVDIEQEAHLKNQFNRGGAGNEPTTTPLLLNLQILVSVAPQTPYVEGMKHLSQAITFFQERPVFTGAQRDMPNGIANITIEMLRLNAEGKNTLWQSLGAKYQPSVVYKMRLVNQNEDAILGVEPEIAKPR